MTDTTTTNYTPGVCNINGREIRKRRTIGFIGLAVLVAVLVGLFIVKAPPYVWLITFIPAFLMTTGFLQAKNKFCVGYASASMQHTGSSVENVTDSKAITLDRNRASAINKQVAMIALLIALAAFGVAFLL